MISQFLFVLGGVYFTFIFWKDSFAGYKILVWNVSSYCPLTPLFLVRNQIWFYYGFLVWDLSFFFCCLKKFGFGFDFQHFYFVCVCACAHLFGFFVCFFFWLWVRASLLRIFLPLYFWKFLCLSLSSLIQPLHVCWYI